MARGGAAAVRRELEDGIAQILILPPGEYAAGVSAFNLLRKGTLHAATGREAPLAELLDDLEPKGAVLRFVAGLHREKRIYRKQIEAVLTVLLQSAAWRAALEEDDGLLGLLPEDIFQLAGAPPPAPAAVAAAGAGARAAEDAPLAELQEAAAPQQRSVPEGPGGAAAAVRGLGLGLPEGAGAVSSQTGTSEACIAAACTAAPGPRLDLHGDAGAASSQTGGGSEACVPAGCAAGALQEEAASGDVDGGVPDAAASVPQAAQHVPAAGVASFEVRAAIAAASANLAKPSPPARRDEDARSLLADAGRQVEAITRGGCQSLTAADLDEALTVFESFRRAVAQATRTASVGGREALSSFEPKGTVLRFLAEFAHIKRAHRSRIASTLACLLGFDGWQFAAEADPATREAVRGLTGDTRVKMGDATAVDLRTAAARVSATGGVGALCVQVLAAHNLLVRGTHTCPSTYVRLSLGGRVKRTAVSGHCRWDAAPPFVFEVLSLNECLRLEVLDGRLLKDQLLGALEIPVSAVPLQTGLALSRHALSDVPHAELELGLALAVASQMDGLQATDVRRPPATVPQLLERAIMQLRTWEREGREAGAPGGASGPDLKCPAGHPVTKRKEGLRWHQKVEFWRLATCDFCNEALDAGAVRWRCQFHCDFDLCEACHAEALEETQGIRPDAPSGLGPVRLPPEAMERRSEAVFFCVEAAAEHGGAPRRVARRYNDFLALADRLGPRALCLPGAPFPEKTLFGCRGERLEERRRGLEAWLQQVVESPSSQRAWRGPVREFLCLSADGTG